MTISTPVGTNKKKKLKQQVAVRLILVDWCSCRHSSTLADLKARNQLALSSMPVLSNSNSSSSCTTTYFIRIFWTMSRCKCECNFSVVADLHLFLNTHNDMHFFTNLTVEKMTNGICLSAWKLFWLLKRISFFINSFFIWE